MTLFEKTLPAPSRDYPCPRDHALERFTYSDDELYRLTSLLSEDNAKTICVPSLIMLVNQLEREIARLNLRLSQLEGLVGTASE